MITTPLVSVVCVCFNHKEYVVESLRSVLAQTYDNIEIIVVDDASTDGSAEVIRMFAERHSAIRTVLLSKNVGNCKAFNAGLQYTTGRFIVDLAADDILLPERIARGVDVLLKQDGVNFTDAQYINAEGKVLYKHSDKFPHHGIPSGNLYRELIKSYFICPPTVMFSRVVIERLRGYDENLTYEDFDFWIRSSRIFPYFYTSELLVQKRILGTSLSAVQFRPRNRHHRSTYKVCEKILKLNTSPSERVALNYRLLYEVKWAFKLSHWGLAFKFIFLSR